MTQALIASGKSISNAGTPIPLALSVGTGSVYSDTTEVNAQLTWRTAGTFSNLYLRLTTNSVAATSTCVFRKGGASGNQSVSIGSSSSGEKQDVTHSDVVSAGNLINYLLTNGSVTGTITFGPLTSQFAPTTSANTVNKLVAAGALTDTSAVATYYQPLGGNTSLNTTEANVKFKNKNTATLQNLVINITTNTATIATVISRKNTAAGNLTISVSSGVTGKLEDTTHTDSLVTGDLVDTAVNSTVTTTITYSLIAVDYLTTNNTTQYMSAVGTGVTLALNATRFTFLGGDETINSTESSVQTKANLAFTASNLEGQVIVNSVSGGTDSGNFRKNTANGNQTFSVPASTIGYFEDAVHSDSVISTDEIDYSWQCATGGSSVQVSFIGIQGTYPASTSGSDNWYPDNPDRRYSNPVHTYDSSAFVHGTPGYTTNPSLEEYQPLLSPQPQHPVKPRDNYSFTFSYGLRKDGWTPNLSQKPQKEKVHYPEVEFTTGIIANNTIVGLDTWLPKQDVPQKVQKKDSSDDDVFISGTPGYTNNPRLEEYQPLLSPQPQKPVKPRDNYSLTMAYGLANYDWPPQLSQQPQPIKTQKGDTYLTAAYGLANSGWYPNLSPQPQPIKIQLPYNVLTATYGLARNGWYPQLSQQPQKEKVHYTELEFTHGKSSVPLKTGWYPQISQQPQKIILNSSISMLSFVQTIMKYPEIYIGKLFN